MSNETHSATRRTYSEPRLVEYGALSELTRAANGSGADEDTMTMTNMKGQTIVSCKTGMAQQGKKTCGFG